MHLFKIRSKSSQPQSDRSPVSSSGSISSSSSRPPLVPQTNLSLPDSPSPSRSNDLDVSPSKYSIGRKISNHEPEEHRSEVQSTRNLAPPPRTSSRALKMTYANHSDMYTQNDLNTFSFGAAPSSSSSSVNPIDPLSRPRDDPDPDDLVPIPDTTPRPSVVGAQHPRSHQSQQSSGLEFDQSPYRPFRVKGAGKKPHRTDSDTASTHTFGNSSTSVSSCSRPSGTNSRAASRTSGRSNTTPQTSDNGLTSDEEPDGRHPLPADLSSPDLPYEYGHTDQNSSLYHSEEDFDVYYDHDSETGIEIDSVAHPGSDRGTFDYHNTSQESDGFDYAERRGSQALPITSSSDRSPSDRSYLENRARENSQATLRRPSKSLDELYSFNVATASSSSVYPTERPLPPAPMSVPQSEGDWRDLRKKSIQRDKDLPPISPHMMSTNVGATSAQNQSTSELDGFDSSWMHQYGVSGVVGFDLSEMQDIVEENGTGRRPSNYPFHKESMISAFRRQSNVSNSNVDIMYRHATGQWASQKYRDQQRMWTFMKEHDRLPDEDVHIRQNHMERERSSISSFFTSRPNNGATPEPGVISSGLPFFDNNRDKEKSAGKEKEIWRGMPLDSEEFWNNQATGRFRVHRRNTPCPEVGKPPQQRLNISFIRTPYVVNPITRDVLDGPAVTIHRHSKAGAFSISRHFRAKGLPNPSDTTVSLRNPTSSSRGQPSLKDSSDGTRKRSDMILLGTRKVQKAYTSTNTTRKLQSHGLLDDSGRTNPRDVEKMNREHEREMRAKAKEKAQDRVKDKKEREAPKEKRKGVSAIRKITSRGESKSKEIPDSSGGSSAGSVANALSSDSSTFVHTSTATTTPDPSEATSSFGSIEHSIISYKTTSSDRTTLRATSLRSHYQRRHPGDIGNDSSDEGPRYPTRTPHRETYAALPPEVFESAHHQEHPTHGLFGWGKSKNGNQIGHRPNLYETSYNPPWPVTTPRINSETRKGIVDDLNTSFQDVGLLPAIGEIKNSHSAQIKRKREREQQQAMHVNRRLDQTQAELFGDVPSDALCMLLPLWPGETDPASARKHPSAPPPLPINSRQYVLIYYKAQPQPMVSPQEEGKTKSGDKKRSRNSPTSAHDPASKRAERGVLLNNFYIGARVITHRELQGTGIRIPDVGLAVSGPLEDAYNNMPTAVPYGEYILGMCNSRDAGIDFLQEGFEKMGLSRYMPNPNPIVTDDDDDCQSLDTVTVLTPLGRAVMEMAWLGGLALTSFNPNG